MSNEHDNEDVASAEGRLLKVLASIRYSSGAWDPTGGDGYAPDSWDDIMRAFHNGLLTPDEYEFIAKNAPLRPARQSRELREHVTDQLSKALMAFDWSGEWSINELASFVGQELTERAVCRDCGDPWNPVRRGECIKCGSDAGPPKTDGRTPSPLATCMRCGRGMNPGDEMCCPQAGAR